MLTCPVLHLKQQIAHYTRPYVIYQHQNLDRSTISKLLTAKLITVSKNLDHRKTGDSYKELTVNGRL